MKSKLLLLSTIYYLLSTFLLTGCAQKDQAPKELVMWLVGSEGQAQTINELSKQFFQETGTAVRCEAISWGEAHSKYLTSIAGGVVPDIGTMGLTWGTEFGSLGAMVNLTESFPQELEEIKNKTFQGIWASTEYLGNVFAIPFDLSVQVLYYRNDIILKPPQTWEELTQTLVQLHTQNKGMIFDWGSLSWIGFSPYLWQAGGDFYTPDGTDSALTSPEAEKALRFFVELYTKYHVPKTQIPVEQGMRTGDFPLAISGNWKIDGLRLGAPEIKEKWDIALLPAGPTGKHTTFIGGRVMGIFAQSKRRKEAWEFIKFLFRPDTQVKLYEAAQATQETYLPPNMETWDKLPMSPKFKEILKQQVLEAKGPPSVLGWDSSTRFIDEAIQKVVLEAAAPNEALSIAAYEMKKYIGKIGE